MKKEVSWKEIGKLALKLFLNILSSGISLWIAVNLFLIAFNISLHLTLLQAISIFVLAVVLGNVFGIGDR